MTGRPIVLCLRGWASNPSFTTNSLIIPFQVPVFIDCSISSNDGNNVIKLL